MKKLITSILCAQLILMLCTGAAAQEVMTPENGFYDVAPGHWAYEYIIKAKDLGVMSGIGNNNFGLGRDVSRAEFTTMLVRLFSWETASGGSGSFRDVGPGDWYYGYVESALSHGALTGGDMFRPNNAITRSEMAVMLVRALGFGDLGGYAEKYGSRFSDVAGDVGYIALASDFGIITGVTESRFDPDSPAKREEAAAMMIRLHSRYYSKLDYLHGFYAISSWSQKDILPELDAASFGWARMELSEDMRPDCNMTRSGGNILALPDGYGDAAKLASGKRNLSVFLDAASGNADMETAETMLLSAENRQMAADEILSAAVREYTEYGGRMFTGVTIDFEGLEGAELRSAFTDFLEGLSGKLKARGLELYVTVPPKMHSGAYYGGYDYRAIGRVSDKVILMAHDYHARKMDAASMESGFTTTPLTPYYEIYYALSAALDPQTGIEDKSKVVLALSFDSNLWMLKDGKVVSETSSHPTMEEVYARLVMPDTVMEYSDRYRNPCLKYHDPKDDTDNVLWYEDSRSVHDKISLARMLGVQGISLWRLGTVPMKDSPAGREIYFDIWDTIKGE